MAMPAMQALNQTDRLFDLIEALQDADIPVPDGVRNLDEVIVAIRSVARARRLRDDEEDEVVESTGNVGMALSLESTNRRPAADLQQRIDREKIASAVARREYLARVANRR